MCIIKQTMAMLMIMPTWREAAASLLVDGGDVR